MRIDTDNATDAQMAKLLVEGLEWLSREGRSGARLVAAILDQDPDNNVEEAASWITDIAEGKEL